MRRVGLNKLTVLALFLAITLAACGGVTSPTTTPVPTAALTETSSPVPTTALTETSTPVSTPAPTATATPAPLALGPEALLEGVKAAMADLKSFHLEGELVVKATSEADANLMSMRITGSGNVKGDNQLLLVMDLSASGLPGTLTFGIREVQGVSYTQDPLTGEWAIDDTAGQGDDSFNELLPEGMAASEAVEEVLDGQPVYRLTGSVPDDPEQERVVLWVGADDLLVRQMLVEGRIPATDFEGLIPGQEAAEIFQSTLLRLSRFNEPVRVASPLETAIRIQSLSDLRAGPMSLLTITASGIDLDSDLQVRFFDGQGYSVDIPAASVGSTSLTVRVPPFVDLTTGAFGPGVVSVQLVQKSTTGTLDSNTIGGFQIEDLPTSAEPTGTVTLAYFDGIIRLYRDAKEHLIILERISDGEDSNPELVATLDELRNAYIAAKKEVEAVIADPGKSFKFAEFGDDILELNIATIANMDRLIGSVVQQVLASSTESAALRIGNGNSVLLASKQEPPQNAPIDFVLVHAQPENPVEGSLSLKGLDPNGAIQRAKIWADSAGTIMAVDSLYHKSWQKLPKDPNTNRATGSVLSRLSATYFFVFTVVPASMVLYEEVSAMTAATGKVPFKLAAPAVGRYVEKVGPGLSDLMTKIPILGITVTATGALITVTERALGLKIEDVSGRGELQTWIKEAHFANGAWIDKASLDPDCSSSLNLVMGLGERKPVPEGVQCGGKLATYTSTPTPTPTPTPIPTPTPAPKPTVTPTFTPPPTATPTPAPTATPAPTPTPIPRPVEATLTSLTCIGRELLYEGQYIYSDYFVTGTITGSVGTTMFGNYGVTSGWTETDVAGTFKRGPGDPETTVWQGNSIAGALGGDTLTFSIDGLSNGRLYHFSFTDSCPN